MIKRTIEDHLRIIAKQFKAIAITGPRQSGKTTLARKVFLQKPYVSLDSPDQRRMASEDPRLFLGQFPEGCIIDEIQRVPELFSYLQEILDKTKEPGLYIFTASQNFGLMENMTQSLAGRVGILTLLPFSYHEMLEGGYAVEELNKILWKGGYPPIYDQKIDARLWLDSYITTYVERDVRQIVNVQNSAQFQRFMALCAGNSGQLLNASRIGADCGIRHSTVEQWLNILESSYVAFRLQPHYQNFRKRLVKTPKLYFWDVGLAIRLLEIETADQLTTHPLRGALFENWVIVELLKGRYNRGFKSNLYFWRNHIGLEVDVVAEKNDKLIPIEIKSGSTYHSDWLSAIMKWGGLAEDRMRNPTLVYGGDRSWREKGIEIVPWRELSNLADRL